MDELIVDAERARRLARAILSDVKLYNIEAVRKGIESDDLFERLAPELREAREYFESRVDREVGAKSDAWGRALVDVLIFQSAHVRSRIW